MKLVRLYIENFGGLSRYELNFEAGITAINRPNGFGKTTLAEFIRAMLYGFPRKGKTLEKSKRQKYAPWNGGKYGGNLVFEHDGQQYRIERTFGTTPKADTFKLIDLVTNRRSDRFSEEIGIQLFGLDSDSFERSAYVPQNGEVGQLATTAIQAKLSDLVEDSCDVNNYDKAMAQLRAKRSALIPYRGSGGAVAEASAEITQLQLRLDELLMRREELAAAEKSAAHLEVQLEKRREELGAVVEKLSVSLEMATAAAQQRQYAQLQQQCSLEKERAEAYAEKAPHGRPDLQNCREKYEAYENLQKRIRNLEQHTARLLQEDRQGRDAEAVRPYTGLLLLGILCAAVGAAGLAGGVGMLLQGNSSIGLAALCGGIGLLAVGIAVLTLRGKKRRAQVQSQQLRRNFMDSRIASAEQELQMLRKRAKTGADEIAAFLEAYGVEVPPQHFMSGLMQLEHHIYAREQALHMVQELTDRLAAMEKEWGDALLADCTCVTDPRLLRQQEQHLREEVTQLERQLQLQLQRVHRLREQTAQIPQLREELVGWQEKLAKMRQDARLLDDTMDYLQQARERLSGNYLRTIESRFGAYLTQLEGNDGEKYLIDTELQVQLERMGQVRELAYFSAGQAELVMLCMRLALVDALFQGQEVFMILDDPFVNLDDTHTAQALKLLRSLSKERQILYLTCHSSRTL